jgi:trk system potassium uptake protein TrkH
MAFGGYSASTAGGFKAIRTGIVFKAIIADIKKYFLPRSGVTVEKFHHLQDAILNEKIVKSAALIILLYIVMHTVGAIVGVINGIPFIQALFESISAGANVGLSCGVTAASMANSLKVTYIINMFLGRLEFIAVFVFILFIFRSIFRKA